MKRTVLLVALAAIVVAYALGTTQALAQRVFVAAQGSDSNPCSFALPCRTFQHAHDVVAAGGEIDVLDPAGYGAVTITKAISIQGHDFSGVSTPSGGTGITINAGANDFVALRGLIIEGAGIGNTGIQHNSGGRLTIQNCVVRNLVQTGILLVPNAASDISLSDTYVSDTGFAGGFHGILVRPTGAHSKVTFNRVESYRSGDSGFGVFGDLAGGFLDAVAVDSVATSNKIRGFVVQNGIFTIDRSTASFNGANSFLTLTGGFMKLSRSLGDDASNPGSAGLLQTYGDNYLTGGCVSCTTASRN
jgi:hypothetical protein